MANTDKEKIYQYERFLNLINLAQTTMNQKMMQKLIQNADNWSYAHRMGNGELSQAEIQENIDHAFDKLCEHG